jgi:hypothetical protein
MNVPFTREKPTMQQPTSENPSLMHMERPSGVDRQTYMQERGKLAAQLLAQGMGINHVARRLHSSRPFVQRVADADAAVRRRKIA